LRCRIINVIVDSNSEFVSRATGWISADGTLNTDVYLNRSITPGLRTTITVQYKIENSAIYQTLLNYDVDTCRTIKDLLHSRLTTIWFRNVHKYGNLSSKCPIRPGYYSLRNLQLENSSIPAYLRPGNYRLIDFNYYGKPGSRNSAGPKTRRLVSAFTLEVKLY
ncbi:hypothetical protein KR222_008074, partial [Zaprionus bogoriensis]